MRNIKFILLLLVSMFCHAQNIPLHPIGHVNDFAHVLSPEVVTVQEAKLVRFRAETGIQIALVTVESLDGSDIESYSNKLFRTWGIGEKGKNNGVLFLYVKKENRKRIEVGRGLEGALPDITAKNILIDLRPMFADKKN